MPAARRHDPPARPIDHAVREVDPSAGDASLARRCAAGDETALAAVYDRHGALVYGLALKVTRVDSVAEDIAQDVFTTFWEHPERFDGARGTLRAYLGVLTHRRAVDWVRREEAARRRIEREARRTVAPTTELGEGVLTDDAAVRIRRAVDALPAEQRDAVLLAYFGGKTYREVAVALGIPEGTAKSRLRLALAKLATVLRERELTPWN